MPLSRRGFTLGSTGALALAGSGLARPAVAQGEPIRVGWLAALTGPASAPGTGFDRGVRYAVEAINGAGGVKGRQVELVTRDTQGDPTKAVNATQEMISRAKVHAVWGPTNSGDAQKYPNAFRLTPSNQQWDDAARDYCLKILKLKNVAVVGDTTGYGTTAVGASVAAFKKDGANVVYQAQIDATQPDVTPDMLRMKSAGAEAIVVWSVSTGMESRLMNTRASMGWDVPLVGHPAMGSGEVGKLIAKPENWEKVYIVGYKSCSYGPDGKLPPRTQEFVDRVKGKVELSDTSLWWVLSSVDAVNLIAKAVAETGSTASEDFIRYWNTLDKHPGLFGTYTFTPQQHNGYPTDEVVMSRANSQRDGAFALAPGYV
jgi:branched-chain amino acid transport system substrate-binding protein